MRQVALRAGFLLRRPAVLLVGLLVAGGGAALVELPLLGMPGFELSLALSIAIGLLGGIPGGAAASLERRIIQGRDPRPKSAVRYDSPAVSALKAISAGALLNLAFLVPPLAAASLYAAFTSACNPFDQIGFVPLLPLGSALFSSAAGAFCGFSFRRKTTGTLFYFALLAGSLVATAWPIVAGPQVFAYNHFLGHVPGPLYDEALAVTPALVWFRVETLLVAACLWLSCAVLLDMKEGRNTRPHFRPGPGVLLLALALCVAALEERSSELGFRMTYGYLSDRLGGIRETEHFVVLYPRGDEREDLARLERDLEFRHAQLSALLGAGPAQKIRVYVYRGPEEKRALVGAGRTQFAKPWLGELHVDGGPFPLAVLKHELAHVVAAPLGRGPFDVTTRYGVVPVVGLIEGTAVAADDPVDELTLHQWAAGMRRQKLAPDIRDLLGPRGFYKSAPGRAYTLAGSFLRYLADTYGPEKLRVLYGRGDFESAYGRTLDALATEWEKFLESVPLDPAAEAQAFKRFRQGSIFARPCAREVAVLYARGIEELPSDPTSSLQAFRRCAALQPEEPTYSLAAASALSKLDRGGEALHELSELEKRIAGHPSMEADVALAKADIAFEIDKPEEAAADLTRALELAGSPAVERTARVKLAALRSPLGAAIWGYFKPGHEDLKLLRLREALDREPDNAFLAYLLGRRLAQSGAPLLARTYLQRALKPELPDSIRREALRLSVEADYLAGDCAAVRDEAGRLPDLGLPLRRTVGEWVERCDFEQKAFKGALVPPSPFE